MTAGRYIICLDSLDFPDPFIKAYWRLPWRSRVVPPLLTLPWLVPTWLSSTRTILSGRIPERMLSFLPQVACPHAISSFHLLESTTAPLQRNCCCFRLMRFSSRPSISLVPSSKPRMLQARLATAWSRTLPKKKDRSYIPRRVGPHASMCSVSLMYS